MISNKQSATCSASRLAPGSTLTILSDGIDAQPRCNLCQHQVQYAVIDRGQIVRKCQTQSALHSKHWRTPWSSSRAPPQILVSLLSFVSCHSLSIPLNHSFLTMSFSGDMCLMYLHCAPSVAWFSPAAVSALQSWIGNAWASHTPSLHHKALSLFFL